MGGATFYWRVTLVEGRGREGVFDLEECVMPLGEPIPLRPSYGPAKRLTHEQLVKEVHYDGEDVGRRALSLSTSHPQITHTYDRWMPV